MVDARFSSSDGEKSVSITTASMMSLEDPTWVNLNAAMSSMNAIAPLASLTVANNTVVITTKDSRVFTAQVILGANPPQTATVSPSSTQYWSQSELEVIHVLVAACSLCSAVRGMSILNVTYN